MGTTVTSQWESHLAHPLDQGLRVYQTMSSSSLVGCKVPSGEQQNLPGKKSLFLLLVFFL